jgi:tetratricopeptide (TPR) repeat protein
VRRRLRGEDALAGLTEALRLAREVGYRYAESQALTGLAGALGALGHQRRALAHAERALEVTRLAGFRLLEGLALTALAEVRLARRELGEALGLARQAPAATTRPPARRGTRRSPCCGRRGYPTPARRRCCSTTLNAKEGPDPWSSPSPRFPRSGSDPWSSGRTAAR